MSDLMVALIRSLMKNGVKAPADTISFDYNSGRFTGDLDAIILDFSEHDKMVAEEKDKKIEKMEEDLNRLTMDLKNRMRQIYELKEKNEELDHMRKSWIETATKRWEETLELERKIEDLEAIISDGKKPDISVSENGVSVGCECGGYHLAKARIAELEKENNSLKEKISFIRTRVTEEARDFWDKDMFGSLVVTVPNKSNSENKINLNDRVKVKLTPLGVEIFYHQYDELNKITKANGGTPLEPVMPQIDKDGYTEFTLHHFISLYGKHIGMAKPNVIQPINIIIL